MVKKLLGLLLIVSLVGAGAQAGAQERAASSALPAAEREDAPAAQSLSVGAFELLRPRAPYDPDAPEEGTFFDGEVDLDGDGAAEKIVYTYAPNSQEGTYAFRLCVNGLEAGRGDAIYLTGEVGAVRFAGVDGAFVFVADAGPSDDPVSYIYRYLAGEGGASLREVGTVEAFPSEMTVTGRNTFAAYVRASKLFTWYRPADFVVAVGSSGDGDGAPQACGIAEVPRELYPVGACVTARMEIPLAASRTDQSVCRTLQTGEAAVLAACDDRDWCYIVAVDAGGDEPAGGWLRLDPDSVDGVLIDGAVVSGMDAFDGLLYAD